MPTLENVPISDTGMAGYDIYIHEPLAGSGLSTASGFKYHRVASYKRIETVTKWLLDEVVMRRYQRLSDYVVVSTDIKLNTMRCSAAAWMAEHAPEHANTARK